MAKIGNEARLILKLAEERMAHNKARVDLSGSSRDYTRGYGAGVHAFIETLTKVARDLEAGRL